MKTLKKIMGGNNGAYTLETAIIMVIVFFVVLFLIAVNLILYEQARLSAIAESAAERAAIVYTVNGKNMETGAVNPKDFKEVSPYWRLFDIGTNGNRVTKVKEFIKKKLGVHRLVDTEGNKSVASKYNIKVEYQNFYIYKRVKVQVSTNYKVPFGGFLGIFLKQFKNGYPIKAEASAAVNDQAEMIRTVDMVKDIAMQFPVIQKFKTKYEKGINNITSKIAPQKSGN